MSTDIYLVDRSHQLRNRIESVIAPYPNARVISQDNSVQAIMETIVNRKPDLLLIDIDLAGKRGKELVDCIKAAFPKMKLVIYSNLKSTQFSRIKEKIKADFVFDKSGGFNDLASTLRSIVSSQQANQGDILCKTN